MNADCWTEATEKFREFFDEYRRKKLFIDVTLIASNNEGGEVEFPVHRAILAAVSPYVMFHI